MMHILPIKDIKEHTEDTTCICRPSIIEESGEIMIIHNSFDGREAIEELYNTHNNQKNNVQK